MQFTSQPGPESLTQYFRRVRAADYVRNTYNLPCQPSLLAKLACIGGGPVFHKAGRTPIYLRTALDEWARARLGAPLQSTSDLRLASSPAAVCTVAVKQACPSGGTSIDRPGFVEREAR